MCGIVCGATAAILALASPAFADGDGGTIYQRDVHTYEYQRAAPPVVVERRVVPAPVVTETVVVRRPVVVVQPPVVVEDYPVYAAPLYRTPRVYAYGAFPAWRGGGWGHRRHFPGHW